MKQLIVPFAFLVLLASTAFAQSYASTTGLTRGGSARYGCTRGQSECSYQRGPCRAEGDECVSCPADYSFGGPIGCISCPPGMTFRQEYGSAGLWICAGKANGLI
jgi:hypothetical protein